MRGFNLFKQQSPDIALGVDQEGAGDKELRLLRNDKQRIYAISTMLAHKLLRKLELIRKENYSLRPDGKTQATIEYENDKIKE